MGTNVGAVLDPASGSGPRKLTQRETSDSEGRLDVTALASWASQWPGPGRRQLWKFKLWSQNETDARAGVSAIGA